MKQRRDDMASTDQAEIQALRDKLRSGHLDPHDFLLLDRLLSTLLNLLSLLQRKNASIKRLKRLLFGPGSDPISPASVQASHPADEPPQPASQAEPLDSSPPDSRPKPRGHGRRSADHYRAARVVDCRDPQLQSGDRCPDSACSGHLYDTDSPALLIRLTGQPLVGATRYEQQVLRCSACQQRYTAPLPQGVPAEKHSPTSDATIALAHYGSGMPFYRLARLQADFSVPLAESTLFERCERMADSLLPVFLYLRKLAASAEVLYSDDTRVRILSLMKENQQLRGDDRRGMHTTGIVAEVSGHQITLFVSSRRHAGENLDELLKARRPGLPAPIQMGDALVSNWSPAFERIISKCLAHARRQFEDIESAFPLESQRVIKALAEVYGREAQTREMSGVERLLYHQQHSAEVMAELRGWIDKEFAQRRVEPNSGLGKALQYLVNHWEGLTAFLRVAGAPLDNNRVERALKLAVLHRKNALFYKTEHGAAVGDIIMSLIETCRSNGVSAWEYLVTVAKLANEVRKRPADFLPWNYPREEVEARAA